MWPLRPPDLSLPGRLHLRRRRVDDRDKPATPQHEGLVESCHGGRDSHHERQSPDPVKQTLPRSYRSSSSESFYLINIFPHSNVNISINLF